LSQQLINERRLAVIDVRNDGNITDFIHGRLAFRGGKRGLSQRLKRSQTSAQLMREKSEMASKEAQGVSAKSRLKPFPER